MNLIFIFIYKFRMWVYIHSFARKKGDEFDCYFHKFISFISFVCEFIFIYKFLSFARRNLLLYIYRRIIIFIYKFHIWVYIHSFARRKGSRGWVWLLFSYISFVCEFIFIYKFLSLVRVEEMSLIVIFIYKFSMWVHIHINFWVLQGGDEFDCYFHI